MQNIPLEVGTLTTLLTTFEEAFTAGYSKISPNAMDLLGILATLEVAVAAVWWTLCEENALVELLKKIMKIGFFIFVVTKYQFLIHTVLDGFVFIGFKAGGAESSISLIKDPSAIVKIGLDLAKPIDDAIAHYNPVNIPKILLAGFSEIMVILAFFALAVGIFITYLEFYLISVLGLILIPFGAFKYTAFLAEKVFGAVISFGVRLMVMSFILATASPILTGLKMPANPEFNQVWLLFLIAITIAGLSWHASALAGGLLSGSPSLTPGTVAGTALAAGAAVAGAGIAAKAAASAGFSATSAGAGAMSGGSFGTPAGSAAATDAGSSLNASSSGSRGGTSGGTSGGASGGASGGGSGASGSGSTLPKGGSSVPSWAVLAMAQRAIPQDAHPGAGVSVPLKE